MTHSEDGFVVHTFHFSLMRSTNCSGFQKLMKAKNVSKRPASFVIYFTV